VVTVLIYAIQIAASAKLFGNARVHYDVQMMVSTTGEGLTAIYNATALHQALLREEEGSSVGAGAGAGAGPGLRALFNPSYRGPGGAGSIVRDDGGGGDDRQQQLREVEAIMLRHLSPVAREQAL
jgi:hypothetical protein